MARNSVRVKVEGLQQLERALVAMGPVPARRVGRKALREGAAHFLERAEDLAPELRGQLKASLGIGRRLTRRQAALHRRMTRESRRKSFVEMFVGAGGVPHAHLREWGSDEGAPSPFMRPAFDGEKEAALRTITRVLRQEVVRELNREARRAARAAGRAS